ncbi:hypothetical protein [Niabella soli]|uniref:Uncharacterized protein n=1 Tax=Niabella soli DSM 19437 TaxID=929713 RepID=W0F8D4_9BACT|nr:hypothetical protein [Niabella soli]AHF17631.1 hypothetical protein NIASO_11380 [Niabella soli DSM 19437]
MYPQTVSRFGTSPGAKLAAGIGVGLAGAVVNFAIEYGSNKYEDGKFNNVFNTFGDIMKENESGPQGVNIVSTK